MSKHQVVLLPGDGVGPELTDAACRVIEADGVTIRWQTFKAIRTTN